MESGRLGAASDRGTIRRCVTDDADATVYKGQIPKCQKFKWHTAIGLQVVDGLKTSEYLLHTAFCNIEGEITIEEANTLLHTYYEENPAHD